LHPPCPVGNDGQAQRATQHPDHERLLGRGRDVACALIDLITELARFEYRYAGDVLNDILAGAGEGCNGVPAK
jgi:hypothetical protein